MVATIQGRRANATIKRRVPRRGLHCPACIAAYILPRPGAGRVPG
ncbi:hypothetical protein [Acetobacter peroxydans]|nr:hypothetical protein [Acetobacter peroxydans]